MSYSLGRSTKDCDRNLVIQATVQNMDNLNKFFKSDPNIKSHHSIYRPVCLVTEAYINMHIRTTQMPNPHQLPPQVSAKSRRRFFDLSNSSSTGHPKAENNLEGSTSWRDSRSLKLSNQSGGGASGGALVVILLVPAVKTLAKTAV